MNNHFADSAEFRLHIRNLLYEYSITHYTTNYITFTEDLVFEFLEGLQPIPLADQYSLTLVADPFDTFWQIHSLSSLAPYDEIPQTTNDARLYLKKIMGATLGVPKTDKIALQSSYGPASPQETFIPALTRLARENTPKLGAKKKTNIPQNYTALLTSQKFDVLPVEPITDPILIPEEILQLKCPLKPEELNSVKSLLQGTVDMMRPQKSYKNRYLDPENLRNVPFVEPSWPEEIFMPIFPKERLPRSGMTSSTGYLEGFKSPADISSFVVKKIEVDDLEEDISTLNMVTVDGWQTIQSSPPSTPLSKASDSDDELDQLSFTSSPNTDPPLIQEFMEAKIEPVLIPRSRQVGGSSGIKPHMLAGKSLASFLNPLLVPGKVQSEAQIIKAALPPCSSPTPSSLLGQPPSEVENDTTKRPPWAPMNQDEGDLDRELKHLYEGHDLGNMIMAETIEDKPDMLMDVPFLPEPNVHPSNDMHMPKAFSEFLIPPGTDAKTQNSNDFRKSQHPPHMFLKKAKGRQSIGLALSWVPFTTKEQLPTVLELVGVKDVVDEKHLVDTDSDLAKVEVLLKSLDMDDKDSKWERPSSWSDGSRYEPPGLANDFQILQTRQERRRLAKLEGRADDGMDTEFDEPQLEILDLGSDYDSDERLQDHRPVKRSRLDLDDQERPRKTTLSFLPPADADTLPANGSYPYFPNIPQIDMHSSRDEDMYDPGSPIFLPSDDKENWPPITSSLSKSDDDSSSQYHTPENMRRILGPSSYQDNESFAVEDDGSFQLLSFGSRQPAFEGDLPGDDSGQPYYEQEEMQLSRLQENQTEFAPLQDSAEEMTLHNDSGHHTGLTLSFEPDIASRSLGILGFAQLRARKVTAPKLAALPKPDPVPSATPVPDEPQVAPQELFDQNTICLPEIVGQATSIHRYMASIDFIQKHALVRALRSEECAVELAERQNLDGIDLIVDPNCAIIFVSLFTLSARCGAYVEKVSQQSWKFLQLLIVFEAYPEQRSKRANIKQGRDSSGTASELCAYTPPIIKAIKKFRRDVNIADACGTKCPDTKIEYAFADTVNQAALLTRFYGDRVEATDETQGAIWGEREWLAIDFVEDDEARLAAINGLNHFSASIILCQVTLQDFVDMSAQERVDAFAAYLGVDAMMMCNTDLDARFEAIGAYSSSTELGALKYY